MNRPIAIHWESFDAEEEFREEIKETLQRKFGEQVGEPYRTTSDSVE